MREMKLRIDMSRLVRDKLIKSNLLLFDWGWNVFVGF